MLVILKPFRPIIQLPAIGSMVSQGNAPTVLSLATQDCVLRLATFAREDRFDSWARDLGLREVVETVRIR
jgi:hypothetical protein